MRIEKFALFFLCVMALVLPVMAKAEISIVTPEISEKIMDSLDVDESDVKKYRTIFKALDKGDIGTADKYVDKLDSNILLGYVLYKKYLETKYKTSPEEIKEWLDNYADLPVAAKMKRFAVQKGVVPEDKLNDGGENISKLSAGFLARLKPADKKFLVAQAKLFRKNIATGKTLRARKVLENKRFQSLAPKVYWDSLAATLAMKYLTDNYDTKALEWGRIASKRHNSGMATWVAGIASWRKKNFKAAASYFARLGGSKNSDEWLKSAALFWAARAYEKIGNHLKTKEMLMDAAQYKYTFYGILAAYKLGQEVDFAFDKDSYINDFAKLDYVNEIIASKPMARALVLLKVKQIDWAERELFNAYDDMSDNQKEAVILLAHQYGLHSLAIAISRQKNVKELKGNYEKEFYPLPRWSEDKSWTVDKALVLALIRQESAFKDNATSRVGARGLMQLMPNTAYHISGDKSIRRDKNKLLNMDYNLELGQKYISYLLEKPFIEGNLFYMLTAYNGGPGNLVKWQKKARYGNDPLLFIEVLPAAETRIYIERVMANYWIYNIRFGLGNPTLEQIANGKWPVVNDDLLLM